MSFCVDRIMQTTSRSSRSSPRLGSRARSSSGSWSSTGFRSSTRGSLLPSLFQALAHPRHQAAHPKKVVHELRKWLGPVLVAFREVADDAFLEVDLELVTLFHRLGRLRRLQDRVAHVDGVAEEDPRERVGDHQRDAGAPDRHRRDLPRRATSEIRAPDQDVSGRDAGRPRVATRYALHRVLAELLLVQGVDRVLGRDDLVGVDVVAELPGFAANDLGQRHGLTCDSAGAVGAKPGSTGSASAARNVSGFGPDPAEVATGARASRAIAAAHSRRMVTGSRPASRPALRWGA